MFGQHIKPGLLVGKDEPGFACKWTRELLAKGPPAPTADRLRCLLRHHCAAPVTVTCPPGLALTGGGGCAPTGRCGVADVAEQAAACMAVGDCLCVLGCLDSDSLGALLGCVLGECGLVDVSLDNLTAVVTGALTPLNDCTALMGEEPSACGGVCPGLAYLP